MRNRQMEPLSKPADGAPYHSDSRALNVPFTTEVDTKQERFLLVTGIVVTAVFIVIGAITLVLVLTIRNASPPAPCETPECFQARDYLVGLLNTSKDACSDFYGYVCDLWLARRGESRGARSFLAERVADSLAILEDYLIFRDATPYVTTASPQNPLLWLIRGVYRKCHQHIFENSTAPPFSTRLETARKELNWAAIRGAGSSQQLVALLVRTSLLAGFHTIFALRVLRENGKPILGLSCGTSLRRKMAAVGSLGDFESNMRRVVQNASELAGIISLDALVDKAMDSVDCSTPEDTASLYDIFYNLAPKVTARNWLQLLNDTLRSANISVKWRDMGLVSGLRSLSAAFRVMDSNTTVAEAGAYLASHVDTELLVLELYRGQEALHPEATAHFCLDFVRRCLPDAWPQLVESALALGKSVEVLSGMFREVKASSQKTALMSWLQETHLHAAREKIDKTALVIAFEDTQVWLRHCKTKDVSRQYLWPTTLNR